jgi:hypothetical protein
LAFPTGDTHRVSLFVNDLLGDLFDLQRPSKSQHLPSGSNDRFRGFAFRWLGGRKHSWVALDIPGQGHSP